MQRKRTGSELVWRLLMVGVRSCSVRVLTGLFPEIRVLTSTKAGVTVTEQFWRRSSE